MCDTVLHAWSANIRDSNSPLMMLPGTPFSQQAKVIPSEVGQHAPAIPKDEQPDQTYRTVKRVSVQTSKKVPEFAEQLGLLLNVEDRRRNNIGNCLAANS